MMFFGAAINAFKAIKNGVTLPTKIKELENEYKKPVGEYLTEIERYYAKSDIALAELYRSFEKSTKEAKNTAIKKFFSEMEKHMATHQDLLNKTNATKFDIEKIAYSINELALLFDTNLDEFEKNANSLIGTFSKESKQNLSEQKELFATELAAAKKKNADIMNDAKNEIHNMLTNAENQLKHQKESIQTEAARIDSSLKRRIAELESKVQSEINAEISALHETREKLRAEIDGLSNGIRKSIDGYYLPLLTKRTVVFGIGLMISIILGVVAIAK